MKSNKNDKKKQKPISNISSKNSNSVGEIQ